MFKCTGYKDACGLDADWSAFAVLCGRKGSVKMKGKWENGDETCCCEWLPCAWCVGWNWGKGRIIYSLFSLIAYVAGVILIWSTALHTCDVFFRMNRKRITATEAIEHPFLELANHRGLGNRIMLDRHRAYMFRRKWEVGLCNLTPFICAHNRWIYWHFFMHFRFHKAVPLSSAPDLSSAFVEPCSLICFLVALLKNIISECFAQLKCKLFVLDQNVPNKHGLKWHTLNSIIPIVYGLWADTRASTVSLKTFIN